MLLGGERKEWGLEEEGWCLNIIKGRSGRMSKLCSQVILPGPPLIVPLQ